jgi:curved DNA-binding protein CbpA
MKDHYVILGIPRRATPREIKKAYRALCKKYHPDVNPRPNANEKIQEINESYAVLSDVDARRSYDRDLVGEAEPWRESTTTDGEPRDADIPRPPDLHYNCYNCHCEDATLRITVFWKVCSFGTYASREPEQAILCARCRVKESLFYNFFTLVLGWWSFYGFFWTLDCLRINALGGDQPKENNAHLLHALAYQFYRKSRFQEAYRAARASEDIKHDSNLILLRENFRRLAGRVVEKSFWDRLFDLELNPVYYNIILGAIVIWLLRVLL